MKLRDVYIHCEDVRIYRLDDGDIHGHIHAVFSGKIHDIPDDILDLNFLGVVAVSADLLFLEVE